MRSRRDRSPLTVAAVAVMAGAGLLGLGAVLLLRGPGAADEWAGVASACVAVVGGAATLIGWLRRDDGAGDDRDAARRERRLACLAERMAGHCTTEEEQRRLLDPYPLPVTWHTLGPPSADHWSVIRQGAGDTPLRLDGTLDDLHRVVRTTVPTGRLVMLGGPGSGKTSLVVRLARACLTARASGAGPVPVILRLSTWDPAARSLRRWITEQVERDYGVAGVTWDAGLLPVLDGLDEMPPAARGAALRAVNTTFAPGLSLVVTSRGEEYHEAVRDADVLTGAAVIELDPLTPGVIRDYLTTATRSDRGAAWNEVFDRMSGEPAGLLARTLSTPLHLSLTRLTYADGPGDPGLLLRLPGTAALRGHLLDQLIRVLYPDLPDPAGGRAWNRRDAHRWLSFLARHLHRRDAYDLPWWELARAVPLRARTPIWAVVVAVVFGAANVLAGLPWHLAGPDPVAGMAADLRWGVGGGLLLGAVNSLWTPLFPRAPRLRRHTVRRTGRPLWWRLCRALGNGLWRGVTHGAKSGVPVAFIVLAIVAVAVPTPGPGGRALFLVFTALYAFLFGFCCGFVYGLAVGFAAEFVTMFHDVEAGHGRPPDEVLRADRAWTAVTALAGGLITAAVTPLFVTVVFGEPLDWRLLPPAVHMGVAGGLGSCLATASTQFLLARMSLSVAGRMPWHAMAFLQDGVRRGALRQVGGAFQFRHALLRDRLAGVPVALENGQSFLK
ncbi:NACHT domain-containing protein [Nonomuraea fuscirosea]|uniref:NACHT domain-containing protein n=1 Tax=Nonomuraea fuscirosea TaxID=1291556 RepID=UPI00341B7966